jgi:cyclophilin family peptidyl-prolyl cis-trans isomerase
MSTDQGDLTLTLDRAKAPCAAASFTYLASKSFFDGSTCHRLVNQPSFGVLQCGDPTGSGSGGPSYKYAEEVTPETTYPRGTIAMAKTSAPNTTGSQFFLCFVDTELPPEYTVVGTVDEAGLAVLDKVAAGGIEGAGPEGDGPPAIPVTIKTLSVVA